MSAVPTRIASAPASSASAPWAREWMALSAITIAVARRACDELELRAPVDREGRRGRGR